MKETLGKPVPAWWLGVMSGVALVAGVLIWLLVVNAPPQNAILVVPSGDNDSMQVVPNGAATPTLTQTILPSTPTPAPIAVYVSGAVTKPGVYTLQPGARIADAVEAAGGLLPDADPEAINLAARVRDEEHISIPERIPTPLPGTVVVSPATAVRPQSTPIPPKSPTPAKVNINTAGLEELESLPLIGSTLATRIIEYRQQNGPFKTVEDLMKVSGIGESALERLRPLITVGP